MKKSLLFYIPILFLCACESLIEEVEVDIPEQQIVVYGLVEPGKIPVINISRTDFNLDTAENYSIENLSIDFFEEGKPAGNIKKITDKVYQVNDVEILLGKTYEVQVSAIGFNLARASFVIPETPEVEIDTFYKKTTHTVIFGTHQNTDTVNTFHELYYQFNIHDNANTTDYYMLMISEFGQRYIYDYYNDFYYYGNEPSEPDSVIGYFPVDTRWNFPFEAVYLSYYDLNWGTSYYVAKETEMYGQAIIFSDKQYNGKKFTLECIGYPPHFEDSLSVVAQKAVAWKISEDYYKYLYSLALYHEGTDFFLSEPVRVYGNVKDGLGVIGAANSVERIFELKTNDYQ